jgi:PII-like signaling protein
MENKGEAKILRVYISNTDKFRHAPLYEVIVFAAKRYGMAGATVLRGFMGFGSSSVIYSTKFWEITEKLPVVVEIVDDPDKVEHFFETIKPYFEKLRTGCLVTIDKTHIAFYKSGTKKNK